MQRSCSILNGHLPQNLAHIPERTNLGCRLVIARKCQITDYFLYLNICDESEFCSTPGVRVTFLFFLQIKCCMFQTPTILAEYSILITMVTAASPQGHVKGCWSNSVQPGKSPLAFSPPCYHECALVQAGMDPDRPTALLFTCLRGRLLWLQLPMSGRGPDPCHSKTLKNLGPTSILGRLSKISFPLTTWLSCLSPSRTISLTSLKGLKQEGISF